MIIKKSIVSILILLIITSCNATKVKQEIGLKDALKGDFLIGVAMNNKQILQNDKVGNGLIIKHFNSIVADNCMKSEVIQPVEGKFDFTLSDQFVNFGEQHKMNIIGHTLIWHSQAPDWFFKDKNGNQVSRDVLIERMKSHITTTVKHYKGRVHGWDVVNEAINDNGTWRESPFYKIIGKDYIKMAFKFAHEADPNAQLYYNDYNMEEDGRRAAVVQLIKELQQEGIRIDAVGMQSHFTMDYPTYEAFEKSIEAFAALGVKVMLTELDLTVLPFPKNEITADIATTYKYDPVMNPYINGIPDSAYLAFNNRLKTFLNICFKHKNHISRITVWGLSDKDSWKNDFPVKGRTDYPLLFDRNYQPKHIVNEIIKKADKK